MSDLVEKVARVIVESMGDTPENAARCALQWLANNVSDEMVQSSFRTGGIQVLNVHPEVIDMRRRQISAAIRAAAGGEQTPPPKGEGS